MSQVAVHKFVQKSFRNSMKMLQFSGLITQPQDIFFGGILRNRTSVVNTFTDSSSPK